MKSQEIGRKIVKNVFFNTLGRFYGLFVNILLTPYLIYSLGAEKYGLWVIVAVITGYFGLLDFGVGSSFTKYIAEFYAKKDFKQLNQLVNTGLVFYGLFGLLIFLLSLLLLKPILSFFNISSVSHPEVYPLFLISVGLFAFSNMISSINTLLWGLQRMDLANKVAILGTTLMALGFFTVLKLDFGLLGLIGVNVGVFLVTSSLDYFFAKKIISDLRLDPRLFRLEMLRKLFGFGLKIQVGRFADMLSFQAHKLIMSKFVSLQGVALYQVGAQVATQTRDVPLLLLSSLLPAVSEMHSLGEKEKLAKLYLKGSKDLALVSIPLAFFFIAAAPQIIRVWIGEGFESAAVVVQILVFGYLTNVNMGVASSIAIGSGKPEMQMEAGIVTALATVILNTAFAIEFGFLGIPVATSLSLVIGALYFYWRFSRFIEIGKAGETLSLYLKPLFVSLVPLGFLLIVNNSLMEGLFQNRLLGLGLLILEGLSFLIIYAYLLLLSGYVKNEDILIWKRAFRTEKFGYSLPFLRKIGYFLERVFPDTIKEKP
jgi:O-antigen/teichoic acid export membrane protein